MKYRAGFKYQLAEDETFWPIDVDVPPVDSRFFSLRDGMLTVKAGYAWDGPSGPTYDSKNSLRASLAHDVLYQMMRQGLMSPTWRDEADLLLDKILKEDGMWAARRWYWLRGVQWFAADAADPSNKKVALEAP